MAASTLSDLVSDSSSQNVTSASTEPTASSGRVVLVVGAEDRLRTDHHDIRIVSDLGRSAQDVGKVFALHRRVLHPEKLSRTAFRSASLRKPANGLFCRSSRARGLDDVSTSR